jgi:hypothetical protein
VFVVFLLATLLGAGLLFLVQPMVAKMLLPSLGGSPAVWNTCMVLFQALLLAGYAYAHLLTTGFGARAQVAVHAAVVLAAAAFLPLRAAPAYAAGDASPVVWILGTLGASLAVPFFLLATTGPLLQRWLASTDDPRGRDPYFLYAAGNLASFAALLVYPFLMEPYLPVASVAAGVVAPGPTQTAVWSWGFAAYAALALAAAGFVLWRGRTSGGGAGAAEATGGADGADATRGAGAADGARAAAEVLGWPRRLLWVLLAFVPSSAMLGTTQALTTDVAAVPLLWVVPLGVYLLTFVAAYSTSVRLPLRPIGWALCVLALGIAATAWLVERPSPLLGLALYPSALAAAGLLCHGRLAADRPSPGRLTEYYLWIAVGGALGGIWNALIAPVVFDSVAEYPLALVLACALALPPRTAPDAAREASRASRRRASRAALPARRSRPAWVLDAALPLALAAGIALLHLALRNAAGVDEAARGRIEAIAASAACLALIARPIRFAGGLAIVFLAAWLLSPGHTLHAERTFFGVLRVQRTAGATVGVRQGSGPVEMVRIPSLVLYHGTTMHGMQVLHPRYQQEPSSYYHVTGPIGHLFRTFRGSPLLSEVGVVGLGVGSLAAYGEPGQRFTFYEIDPAVIDIARGQFTYLRDAKAEVRTVLGDGRLALAAEPDGRFGLLVIDGFSSDSVPVHLLTREAVALYLRKLQPSGLLALHLSSLHFDLVPVVAEIAASLGKSGLVWVDTEIKPEASIGGKFASHWVVIAPEAATLDPLRANPRWVSLADARKRDTLVWTDNHSSPLRALRHW